ncbi:sigma-54 dependent transcriptional regulator [Puniceicoccaceae bacterium K14]|nr:sigma-54 dependent transcriptional regulator [Puniceicoccaceae bacterium K14]
MQAKRLLIADDSEDILAAGRFLFEDQGFEVIGAQSPKVVVEELKKQVFDVAIIDLNYTEDTTSGKEGFDLLEQIVSIDSDLPIMVMTAWATVDKAVEAMRRGARDFIEKPWDNNRLLAWVSTQSELARRVRKSQAIEEENRILRDAGHVVDLVFQSDAMLGIHEMVEQVAPTDASVLITGENGTGKGVIARLLHDKSNRFKEPFISVNMGSVPENLFESELFGHVKGAFTDAKESRIGRVELAASGTLFLDEIGNLPLGQQAKLLRFLETGEFERVGSSTTRKSDARIIAATNANLAESVDSKEFRRDLFYRLATVPIEIPPLRDRVEDIVPLANHFLNLYSSKYGKASLSMTESIESALKTQDWPGNVRELSHTMERAVILSKEGVLAENSFRLQSNKDSRIVLDELSLEEVERYLIQRSLSKESGNVTEAAKRLGMSRATLYRRIKEYGIQ